MQNNLNFYKYSGCGNDFILNDDRDNHFINDLAYIQSLCNRETGIGADGIVLLKKSHIADFKMTIFNADGSEAEMCGNGIRCLGKFLLNLGYPKQQYSVETLERVLTIDYSPDDDIIVDMGSPTEISWDIQIDNRTVHYLNTGVPHVVIFVDDVDTIPVEKYGSYFRHHTYFQPKGANVNFVEMIDPHCIEVRTFERGVEGETLACGTGATAAAIAASYVYNLSPPIKVLLCSGEKLVINFDRNETQYSNVTMSGPAKAQDINVLREQFYFEPYS